MRNNISVDPKVHFGKPCIKGTRITVQNVLELVRDGVTFDQLIADYYPDITDEDIQACLQYAIDVVSSEEIHITAVNK